MSIPARTDPLPVYWEQPDDIREAPMDDEIVLLTPWQFLNLIDCTGARPSSVHEGRCWKSSRVGRWYLQWYERVEEAGDGQKVCAIKSRLIEVVR